MEEALAEFEARLTRSGVDGDAAAEAADALGRLAAGRRPGPATVRVANRDRGTAAGSTHTVVDVVADDLAFVGDSLTAALARRGFEVHRIVEARVQGGSMVYAEIDRETDPGVLARLRVELEDVLEDVRVAVSDWRAMREAVLARARELRDHPPPTVADADVAEAAAFLEWLADDHFTFVGAREYRIVGDGDGTRLEALDGGSLGIARRRSVRDPRSHGPGLRDAFVLTLTKAGESSTVHRTVPLDDIRVRRFDHAGTAIGELRLLGLYAAPVYSDSISRIPVLRRKAAAVIARAGVLPGSHEERTITNVLETLPREEVFRQPVDALTELATGVAEVGERRRVRLFVLPDELGRFVSCLVYLPRDRYTTPTRVAIVGALSRAFGASASDYSVLVGDSVMARLHVVLHLPDDGGAPDVDAVGLEAELADIARAWTDDLRAALQDARGEEEGLDAHRRWGGAFPGAYQDDVTPAAAVDDIAALEALDPDDDLEIRLGPVVGPDGIARLKLYRSGPPLVLSDVMPVLDQLDVVVVDERPYEIRPGRDERHREGAACSIVSFGVRATSGVALDDPQLERRVAELFLGVWRGAIENDGLNRLVIAAGIEPRDVVVLRALARYLHQVGVPFTDTTLASTLVANPEPARGVVALFHARLDPGAIDDAATVERDLQSAIDAVVTLDDDRILRALAAVTAAAVRTNAFSPDRVIDERLAIKLDPSRLEFLPHPRPVHEIWVYAPRVEGVHLRGGDVARGGIRWSDRRDDFRTEILGLMKAQTVKNSVIVPVGAKGGFVVKRAVGLDPDSRRAEVLACYRSFIRGLLDVTDTIVDGRVVPLVDGNARGDGDDPYLVVAADKGTATFSDVANELAAEYGYWLGDAFASGGSHGYDHKEIGITARGAWISVLSHFRAMGVDAATANLSVVGIGDMSGDVFGNGLLQSPHVSLVAAFDHRHVFLDPSPDPAASFAERRRLFALTRSSWADYDPALISPGGAVIRRDAKLAPISPQAAQVLGLPESASASAPTPDELIAAILRAPVDLLWNGGIGTFVKASTESHADVGDRANEAIRVDADQLRCRVVAEGGNLGLTQAARVEYSLGGGRCYTDAIDNSAGVDCSDHEVNIKILLGGAMAAGELEADARDPLLAEVTDEVASLVLADNAAQANALEIASLEAVDLLGVHARQIERLERDAVLDRALERLPDAKRLQERAAMSRGLTPAELAVLLAFTKIDLQRQLLASDVPDDEYFAGDLVEYFPGPFRQRFATVARAHPLRREIVATVVANAVVNRAGISFLSRLADEIGAPLPALTCAHVIARDVYDARTMWSAIDALDLAVPAATQGRMFLAVRRLVERAARWFARRDELLPIGATVSRYREPVALVVATLADLVEGAAATALAAATDALVGDGVPAPLARQVAGCEAALGAVTIAELAPTSATPVETVAAIHFSLAARLRLDWLRELVAALPRADRWQTEARAALRDDLTDCHRGLDHAVITTALAAVASPDAAPRDAGRRAVDGWLDRHRADVDRYERVLDEIHASGAFGLAQLTAARRALRELSESPGSGGPTA